MKTINLTNQTAWEELIRQAEHEDVLVMRDGHAVALLTPFDDDDLEWYGRERDPEFLASIAEAREEISKGESVNHAELRKQLGLD